MIITFKTILEKIKKFFYMPPKPPIGKMTDDEIIKECEQLYQKVVQHRNLPMDDFRLCILVDILRDKDYEILYTWEKIIINK